MTPCLKTTPGDVVLLNAEDDLADTICPRLDKMEADDSRIMALEGIAGRDDKTDQEWRRSFSLETDLPRLEEVLTDNPHTRLVIIDPISAYTGGVDSHKNSDVRGLLAPLADLAGRHQVSVLSVTHLSKGAGSKAIYRAMVSLAFAAAARAVWAVAKDQNDPQRRLFLSAKLNVGEDPDGLAYRIDGGRVCWELDPVRMHADDAFAAELRASNDSGKRGGDQQEAADWLRTVLADEPRPAGEIIDEGDQYGFGKRMLQRALKNIGGVSAKGDFGKGWLWSLPAGGAPDLFSPAHEGDKAAP